MTSRDDKRFRQAVREAMAHEGSNFLLCGARSV